MDLDLSAAGRATEFLGSVSESLVTLHAAFVLGYIAGVAGLRRYRRGGWGETAYAGFLGGITLGLLLAIVFLGLSLDLAEWPLLLMGLGAASIAWVLSGALPVRARSAARAAASRIGRAFQAAAFRMHPPRIPDHLPRELRSIDAGRR